MSARAPPLPPKDSASSSSNSIFADSNATSASYVNQDLAEAVRDSVQIRSRPSSRNVSPSLPQGPQPSQPGPKRSSLLEVGGADDKSAPGARAPRLPSLDPLVPRRTPSPNPPPAPSSGMGTGAKSFQPTHAYSQSSPDMSGITQPALPSTRMQQIHNPNPFEEDEIEPPVGRIRPPGAGHVARGSLGIEGVGQVQPSRAKFSRAQTGASISSSAHLISPPSPPGPGGKTRTRRSMSTDSYGFDAPGMKELTAGQRKALEDKKGSRHADVIDRWDPTGLGAAVWHHSGPYDAAAPSRNVNAPTTKAPMQAFNGMPVQSPPRTGPTTISLSSPPAPPAKDADLPERPAQKRAQSSRQGAPANNRRTSGGLTGQYSTSMPTSGGYFPDPSQPTDEAAIARKERMREREQKRRALKAAWGIDEPLAEPFEDFGGSPNDGSVDITDDVYSPESFNAALPSKPMRSPGLRLGLAPRTAPVPEETGSPTRENPPPAARSASYTANAGGVKRTKSLMQKIKTMRENPRSSSPRAYSPSTEATPSNSTSAQSSEYPSGNSTPSVTGATGRPGILKGGSGRISPQKGSSVPAVPAYPAVESPNELDDLDDAEIVPSGSGSGFVLVESPSSKARAMRALQREHDHSHVPVNRAKHLPMPPVKPVLPTFDDLIPNRKMSRSPLESQDRDRETGGSGNLTVERGGHEGLKRKTSMVKKLRERMSK